ncbi:MAG: hypothetical protein IJ896_06920 [Fibrobacter sp.]|nr:hypothetical protein [Fibrobacter sp.]
MRRLGLGLSFAAMAAFVACSSGSGTGSDPLEDTVKKSSKSTSSDESQEESKSVKKKKRILDDDSNISPSYDNNWPSRVSSIEEAMALDCNAALKCQKVFVEEEMVQDYFYCNGTSMQAYTILDEQVCSADEDDSPDVEECTVKRSGDAVLVYLATAEGKTENVTLTIDASGIITESAKLGGNATWADFDEACKDANDDTDMLSVECDQITRTITGTYRDEDIKDIDALQIENALMCQLMINPGSSVKDLEEAVERATADYGGY